MKTNKRKPTEPEGNDTRLYLQRCGFCQHPFRPHASAGSSVLYCAECRKDRKNIAATKLNARPISEEEIKEKYLVRTRH